jgi:phosphoglycolate phosphatase
MTLPKPTIVIFDMDGTAVRHINPRLLGVLEFFDSFSYRIVKIFKWIYFRGGRGPIIPIWHKKRKQPRLLVHRAIHKFRRKPVEQIVEPGPGLYQLLEFLEEHKILMGLVSNGLGKGYGYDILEKFELQNYFKTTVFREDIVNSKPHPEPILKALEMLERPIEKSDVIWFIGDRRKDVMAALAARHHVPCVITPIAFGLHAATAIIEKNIGQDHIFMSFHDLYDHVKVMFDDEETLSSYTNSKQINSPKKKPIEL